MKLFGKQDQEPAPDMRPPINRLEPDPTVGLSAADVQDRTDKGYANLSVTSPTNTVRHIILSNVFTYFNFIFFALAAALICVGSFNNLTFLGVILVNTAIGIVQELNAKRTLDKLTLLAEPRATVVRDGKESAILTESLVVDDIVIFSAGNQICADAVVVSGEVQVNESLVTGESDEITKRAGDSLLSGSFIVSGVCRARLDKVGHDSFVSKLTLDAKKSSKSGHPGMMRSLTRLVQVIGVVIIPMGIALFLRQRAMLDLTTKENVEKTTAALIGMIPEGLYMLANVALAVSVVKLAKKETLVHDLKCIETLARVDVLCVDKTGTITEPVMEVEQIISLNEQTSEAKLESLLTDFAGNMAADNNTMQALKKRFGKPRFRKAVSVQSFSSTTKTSGVSFGDAEHYLLGAPEFLLKDGYDLWRAHIEPYAATGCRVLMFAHVGADRILTPLGLVLLTNKIRPNARATFEYFTEQGVAIKVISGDNPLTVSAAAAAAGIPDADNGIDLSTVKTDEALEDAAASYTVFGRVTPEQKRKLVRYLKKAGHTVAMTGDGVNDVLALKEADCSVAMASGSDVACQVSHLVLLNSDFASMPSVVAEGRQVINNIERSASLFLVKNIFSFVLSLISIFAVFAYPLTPVQLSLISTTTIGIPAFFLALEKNENLVRGKFLRNVLFRALPAALTDLFIIGGVILFEHAFSLENEMISTISTILMGGVGFAMVFRISRPFNWKRAVLLGGLLTLFVGTMLIVPGFLSLSPIDFQGALVLVVFALLIPSVLFAFSRSLTWLSTQIKTWFEKRRAEK